MESHVLLQCNNVFAQHRCKIVGAEKCSPARGRWHAGGGGGRYAKAARPPPPPPSAVPLPLAGEDYRSVMFRCFFSDACLGFGVVTGRRRRVLALAGLGVGRRVGGGEA